MNNSVLSKRNIGLDILKCLSMLGVVMLHCLGTGGILDEVEIFSVNFSISWLLEIISLHSVNIFAIITGYVSLKSKHSWNRLADLWFSVLFYSVLFAGIFFFIGKAELIQAITNSLPVSKGIHWYFNSYILIWLFSPYINKLISSLNKKQHITLILISLVIFSCYYFINAALKADPFVIKKGYSPTWLLTLYFIGAYLNLYKGDFAKLKKIPCVITFLSCTIMIWLCNYIFEYIGGDIATSLSSAAKSYPSPFLVVGSVSLVLLFSNLNIPKAGKSIITISNSSFFVYIIHTNPFMGEFLTGKLTFLVDKPWYILIASVLGIAVGIYVVCTIIDIIRQKLFKLIHIDRFYDLIIKCLSSAFDKIRTCFLKTT